MTTNARRGRPVLPPRLNPENALDETGKASIPSIIKDIVRERRNGNPDVVSGLSSDPEFIKAISQPGAMETAFYTAASLRDAPVMDAVHRLSGGKNTIPPWHDGKNPFFFLFDNGGAKNYGSDPDDTAAIDLLIRIAPQCVNLAMFKECAQKPVPGKVRQRLARPIHAAVSCDNPALVAKLLQSGATPDGDPDENSSTPMFPDITPLAIAARNNFLACAKLLVEAGASPNTYIVSHEKKPMHESPAIIAESLEFDLMFLLFIQNDGIIPQSLFESPPARNPISSIRALRIWICAIAANATSRLGKDGSSQTVWEGINGVDDIRSSSEPPGAMTRLARRASSLFGGPRRLPFEEFKKQRIDEALERMRADPRFFELQTFEAIVQGNPQKLSTSLIQWGRAFPGSEPKGLFEFNPVLLATVMLVSSSFTSPSESAANPDLSLFSGAVPGRLGCLDAIVAACADKSPLGAHLLESLKSSQRFLNGFGPLHVAAAFGQPSAVKTLLEAGCNVAGPPGFPCPGALSVAVRNGDPATVRAILSSPDAVAFEQTATWDSCALRQAVLEACANPSVQASKNVDAIIAANAASPENTSLAADLALSKQARSIAEALGAPPLPTGAIEPTLEPDRPLPFAEPVCQPAQPAGPVSDDEPETSARPSVGTKQKHDQKTRFPLPSR